MKTLAIIAQKCGSGKTTVSVHMAACAAQRNLKTAIIDIDPQRSAYLWNEAAGRSQTGCGCGRHQPTCRSASAGSSWRRQTSNHRYRAPLQRRRCFDYVVPIPDSSVYVNRPLYRLPLLSMFGVAVCAASVGIARRAIDEFVELSLTKTPTLKRRALRTSPRVHEAVARAEAAVGSARAFVFDALDVAWRSAQTNQRTSIAIRRQMRLAASNATWQSANAVDLMYNAAGGSAVHDTSVLQRCLRDAHVITQHASVNMTVQEQAWHSYLDPAVDYPFLEQLERYSGSASASRQSAQALFSRDAVIPPSRDGGSTGHFHPSAGGPAHANSAKNNAPLMQRAPESSTCALRSGSRNFAVKATP